MGRPLMEMKKIKNNTRQKPVSNLSEKKFFRAMYALIRSALQLKSTTRVRGYKFVVEDTVLVPSFSYYETNAALHSHLIYSFICPRNNYYSQ